MKANASEQLRVEYLQAPLVQLEDDREDDLCREVFGILGLLVDVIDLENLLRKIDFAVSNKKPLLLSTPNVNFLMISQSDHDFRETLLMSDLCPADGMPLVWISRLFGIPLQQRLSGSDIFDHLRTRTSSPKLKVFLFGGRNGVADLVSQKLNETGSGLTCVGALNPGFGSVDDMSSAQIVTTINSSEADLLTVFLTARKAQSWLVKNHERVSIPVRVQLGATVDYQAGKVRRAPPILREMGLEWLWRIKEEPYLWRRYANDGAGLLALFFTKIIPLAIQERRQRSSKQPLRIMFNEDAELVSLRLLGPAINSQSDTAVTSFRAALETRKAILIDLSGTSAVDTRFFGLFAMLRKQATLRSCALRFVNPPPQIRVKFRRNGFEFLLEP
jgi:N-acetylglucosaminyldiphosphoundecaprenol N-acetyl-beta-D-mannosaminyltransferase